MIRFLYWSLALIEVILIIFVLLLFIVTDSRSIKFLAEQTLSSTKFEYKDIEGNLFNGLNVRELSYNNKKLFHSATIRWNPLTLFYNKISLTQVDAKGVELEHILNMVKDIGSSSDSGSNVKLDYSFSLERIHLDINPYVYEGIKFSSFLLETEKILIDKSLTVNTKNLHLSFDSDIVNVTMDGKIEESKLLLDVVNLKNISSKAITLLVRNLKKGARAKKDEKSKKSSPFVFFKEIKAKKIIGTLKPVKYGDLNLEGATLTLKNAVVNPYKNYRYDVKNVEFKGKTNFALLDYKGYIKNSTIHSKGKLTLKNELFSKYKLPLNFKGLKTLESSLKLNHKGVWVEIDHSVENFLEMNNDFNINIEKAKHKLEYIYTKDLMVDSTLSGGISYADEVKVAVKTVVDFNINKGNTTYKGNISVAQFKKLPPKISTYLLKGLKGEFRGDLKGIDVDVESDLLFGRFSTNDYKTADLELQSKGANLLFGSVVENLESNYADESFAATSKTYLNFKNSSESRTNLYISSNLINIEADSNHVFPSSIALNINVPINSALRTLDSNINFDKIENFKSTLFVSEHEYRIEIADLSSNMKASFIYNTIQKRVEQGIIIMGNEEIIFRDNNGISLKSNIKNIQTLLNSLSSYYKIKTPEIEGGINIDIFQNSDGSKKISLSSENLKYLGDSGISLLVTNLNIDISENSDGLKNINLSSENLKYLSDSGTNLSVTNLYDIDTVFTVDKDLNIEIKNYSFSMDENDYINKFYSNKASYLSVSDTNIFLKELWINDQLLLKGNYDFKSANGKFDIHSDSYVFKNENLNLNVELDLKMLLTGKKIEFKGDIYILGESVNYEIQTSGIVEDSDIIIVQDMLKEKDAAFQNLKLYLKIHNKKPLHYYGDGANIEFYNELSIVKQYDQKMLVTGMSTITKGYYELEDKRFILDESHLYFTGDIKKPLLDIKANYEKEQYMIHVFISGTTDEPIVNFNSDPYLKQQEILSLILFDGTGSSSGNGAEAYTLLGGTFAKGLMKSIGIDVDHFLLGTDENDELSLEIGRKISDDITILYVHKDGLNGAKVRVEHSESFETDIIIQPPNTSSIEFLYKRDR